MWKKPVNAAIACVVIVAYFGVFCAPAALAQTPTVKLIVNPNKTDVMAGADPIALTAKASGANLKYKWSLTGPGKIEGEGAAVFYILPDTVKGKSEQAVVTVTVTDDKNQDTTDAFTFNILAKDEPAPAVKPVTAPATAPAPETKQGMSTGTKIAIGVGAVVLIGGIAALAAGGKEEKKPFAGKFQSKPPAYRDGSATLSDTSTLDLKQDGKSISGVFSYQSEVIGCGVTMTSTNVSGTVINDSTATISWPASRGNSIRCGNTIWTANIYARTRQLTKINDKTIKLEGDSTPYSRLKIVSGSEGEMIEISPALEGDFFLQ